MLLNTFKTLLIAAVSGSKEGLTLIDGSTLTLTSASLALGSTTTSSNTVFEYSNSNTTATSTSSAYTSFSYYSLAFGSGTTAPAADDYQIESPLTSDNFTWDAIFQAYSFDGTTKTIVGTITNTSSENITVSEIGVVIAGSSSYNCTLITRSLITAVEIAPNETKTFQYTLDFSGLNDGVS